MIFILDDALELDGLVRRAMPATNVSVLFVPNEDDYATAGCRMWGCDESLCLEQWILAWQGKELIYGSDAASHNQVLVVWESPDVRLQSVLDILANKSPVEIDVAVILIGPIPSAGQGARVFENKAFLSQKVILSSIWYFGNGCNSWPKVADDERLAVMYPLLRLLLSEGPTGVRSLPLFCGAEVRRFATSMGALSSYPPFITAFGLRSWEAEVAEIKVDAVRILAATVAQQHTEGAAVNGKSLKEVSEEMTKKADTTFATIAALGTPFDVNAGDTTSFPEQLSTVPVLEMSQLEWMPTREAFQSAAAVDLESHAIRLLAYRKMLKDELQAISRKIRLNAQSVYERESLGMADFVRSCRTLPRVSALMDRFFPRLAGQSCSTHLIKCEPASTPDARIWRKKSQELKELLKEQLSNLLSRDTVHKVCAVSCATALLVVDFLVYARLWVWCLVPMACAGMIVGVLALYSRLIASRIVTLIEEKAFSDIVAFRQAYVDKLKWVLAKTQMAVENQVKGEARAISRKLGVNYRCFYSSTVQGVNIGGNPQRATQMMSTFNVDPAIAAACGQEIEIAVEQLIDEALSPSTPRVGEATARKLLETLAERLTDGVRVLQPGIESVKVDFSNCAAAIQQPPIPAYLPDGGGNQQFKRFYILPLEYNKSSTWRNGIQFAGGLAAEVLLTQRLLQPMIINLRVGLSQKEAVASLAKGSSPS